MRWRLTAPQKATRRPQATLLSHFLVRTLTAIVLAAVFLGALFSPERALFAALATLIAGVGAYEWGKLCRMSRPRAVAYAAVCVALFALFTLFTFPAIGLMPAEVAGLVQQAAFALAGVFWVVIAPFMLGMRWERMAAFLPALGVLVIVPAAMALLAISPALLLATLAIAWVSDTGAYLGGRAFGRRKLAPAISPGKTWEGVACGLGCVMIYAIIYPVLLPESAVRPMAGGWTAYLLSAALLCMVGVVGDLLESAMKRQAGVKDSGSALPGHGGILDRIDSATAILPLAALLLHLAGPV